MNSATDALERARERQQEPANVFRRRKYSTSDKAHALVTKAAKELHMNKGEVIEILILDGLGETHDDQ